LDWFYHLHLPLVNRSNGEQFNHISTPVCIAALVVTNKNNTTQRDIYYLHNDYQGSLIAAQKNGSTTLEQFSGVNSRLLTGNPCSVNVAFGEFTKPKAYMTNPRFFTRVITRSYSRLTLPGSGASNYM